MMWLGRLAAWAGPALIASVAGRVFRGDPDAPLLLLVALVAPLAALLRTGDRLPATPISAGLALPGLALVLCGNVLLLGDLLRSHGAAPPIAAFAGILLLLVPVVVRPSASTASSLAVLGIAGTIVPVLLVAHATETTPWTAWARAAARPAIVFSEASSAVSSGRPIGGPQALVFFEPHRVTAIASSAVRVLENNGDHRPVSERPLGSGDSVLLRPGDQLLVDGPARLRFEAGKRVPGAAVSGAAWADPQERQRPRIVLGIAGIAVTVLGAALALIRPAPGDPIRKPAGQGHPSDGSPGVAPTRRPGLTGVVATTGLLTAFVVGAGSLGIYAIDAAPELLVGATPLTALVETPVTLASAYGDLPGALILWAFVALFSGMALVLAGRVAEVVNAAVPSRSAAGAPLVWSALVAVAGVASLWHPDAWTIWLSGLGLVAAAWAAPALGARDERGAVVGGIVGVLAFAGLASSLASPAASPWAAVATTPALAAAPLAWAAAWLASRSGRPPRRVAAPARR